MLTIRLSKELEKKLDLLACKFGYTKTDIAREAILEHIEDLEDIYFSLERLKKPAKRWSQEELEQEIQ